MAIPCTLSSPKVMRVVMSPLSDHSPPAAHCIPALLPPCLWTTLGPALSLAPSLSPTARSCLPDSTCLLYSHLHLGTVWRKFHHLAARSLCKFIPSTRPALHLPSSPSGWVFVIHSPAREEPLLEGAGEGALQPEGTACALFRVGGEEGELGNFKKLIN